MPSPTQTASTSSSEKDPDITDSLRKVAEEQTVYNTNGSLPKEELARMVIELEKQMKRSRKELAEQISAAARTAEQTPRPGIETIFTDVYAGVPEHIRRQGQEAFDLARRKGDPAAGEGEFPL